MPWAGKSAFWGEDSHFQWGTIVGTVRAGRMDFALYLQQQDLVDVSWEE